MSSSALLEVHQRLADDVVLAALLSMCRESAANGHDNIDIAIFDVWRALSDTSKRTTDDAIYACIRPLQALGFNVVSYPEDSVAPTIQVYFPWAPLPSSVPDEATVHVAKPRAPWRLVIMPQTELVYEY